MAKTKKDTMLKNRIKNLMNQFKDKDDKEVIYGIAGICNIAHRTASEHFHSIKSQQTLLQSGFKENCEHDWSNAFTTAGGLCKECLLCGEIKFINIENETNKGNTNPASQTETSTQ